MTGILHEKCGFIRSDHRVPLRDAVERRPYPDLAVNPFDIGWTEVMPSVGQFGSTFAWWREKLFSKQKYVSSVTGGDAESGASFKAAGHHYGNKVTGKECVVHP